MGEFLGRLDAHYWRPTFHELERMLGSELPRNARKTEAWWRNERGRTLHHARSWLDAGWRTDKVDLEKEMVTFVKPDTEAAPAADAIAQAEADVVATATRLADTARAKAERVVEHAQGRAGMIASEAKTRAIAAKDAAKDWAGRAPGQAAELVKSNPVAVVSISAGLAFAGGVVLGLLLARPSPSIGARAGRMAQEKAEDALETILDHLGDLRKAARERLPF